MTRRLTAVAIALMFGLLSFAPASAEIEGDFPQVVIFGEQSVDIGQNSTVNTGDVVANGEAGTMSLGNKVTTPAGWQVKANTLAVGNNVNLFGSQLCNVDVDGVGCLPLAPLPVYGVLPVFQPGSAGGTPINVPNSGSTVITPGDYGALTVGVEGTVTFAGPGEFNFTSFTAGRKGQFVFAGGPIEVRVSGNFSSGVEDNFNLAGAPVAASDAIVYVGGNAQIGDKTVMNVNFYAQGLLRIGSNVTARGAYLGNPFVGGQKSTYTLATFFDFQPVPEDDSATTPEDTPVTVAVLSNDIDPEGDAIFVNSVTQGANGSVSFTASDVTYSPNPDYFGPDSFTYEVCDVDTQINEDNCIDANVSITVTPVNDPPTAADDVATTDEDNAVLIDVLGNDSAGPANESQVLNIASVTDPVNGRAEISANQVLYTPFDDYFGSDTFGYTACDTGDGAGDPTVLCDSATVTVTVAPVNDPPTANSQDVFTDGDVDLPITLTASDPDGDVLTFTLVSGPSAGGLTGLPASNASSVVVTYNPNDGSDAEDAFVFKVDDGNGGMDTASVGINPPGDPNDPPDDPTDVVVANDKLCASSVAPIDCSLETIEDTAITLILTGAAPCQGGFPDPSDPNDVETCDGNGNDVPLTFSLPSATTTAGGTLTGLSQGTGVPQRSASVLYTPPTGFNGVDSFTFDVGGDVDGNGGIGGPGETDSGTVEISVQAFTPTPPVEARDQLVSTPKDTPVVISLSGLGACEPGDPDCRPPLGPQSAGPSGAALTQPVVPATDDTGAGQYYAAPDRDGARLRAAPRFPVPLAAFPDEELYAIDSDLDQLFEISPADASSTLVGSTLPGPTTPASLAFDGTNMYTIDLGAGGLYTINLNTGATTLICSTGISGWQGVASDPTDEGQFYGITQDDDLYKIDRTTCTTTQVNATAGTVGGLIAALEFDANGTLWGAEFGSPGITTENAALVTIDKTTGAVTVVSQCAAKPCSGSDNFADGFQGIDFSTDGTLYGQNTNDDSLYIIDTTDGSLTLLGSNSTIFVKGLAFSQEVLLDPGFSILTLPSQGTLSYLDPVTGVLTNITAGDLPLQLTSQEVVYTPPTGVAQLETSFNFQQSDGLTFDTGTIFVSVIGAIIIIDDCAAVGRPFGCSPGSAPAIGGGGEVAVEEFTGESDGLRVVVEGPGGTVSTSSVWLAGGAFVRGLACSGECTKRFPAGVEMKLFARPDGKHFEFVRWGGDCYGSSQIITVRLREKTVCTAYFQEKR